jgi:cell division septation protein DedD
LEQQAKERLTGGVILVVLLVALVPELLTGPRAVPSPTPAQPDQAPMRSYTMDLGESPHVNSAPVAASTAAPSAREAAVAVSSAPEPVPLPAAATAAPQVATPAAPVAVRARAPSAAPAPARTVERGTAVWTVQLGTFSDRENAARLVARLKSHGFSAAISEATKNGHKLFRVRVGTERDRAAAQKLLARLKAAGEKGGEIVLH